MSTILAKNVAECDEWVLSRFADKPQAHALLSTYCIDPSTLAHGMHHRVHKDDETQVCVFTGSTRNLIQGQFVYKHENGLIGHSPWYPYRKAISRLLTAMLFMHHPDT